MKFGCLSNGKL